MIKNSSKYFLFFFLSFFLTALQKVDALPSKKAICESKYNVNFDNTLLIVNFNEPYYANISFLKEIYSPIFPNIVFYGERVHPEVHQVSHYQGWHSQQVILDALTRWPSYESYIFIQDDCLINFWNFGKLDKNKIWFQEIRHTCNLDSKYNESHKWWWEFTQPAIHKALNELPNSYLEKLAQNQGGSIKIVGQGWADFIHIPQRLRKDFINVLKILGPPIFQEVAIFTAAMCIEDIHLWEIMHCSWGQPTETYSKQLDWFHPAKFSLAFNRLWAKNIIEEQLR